MLEAYTFIETPYHTSDVRAAIQPTRGRNADGTPKVMNHTNDEMVDCLEQHCSGIVDQSYLDAFRKLDRAVFLDWDHVSEERKAKVFTPYTFLACVFAEGQTVPAANLILSSLVNLDIQPGQNMLEIGAGSGYFASLMASVAGEGSHIYTTEISPTLLQRAKKAVANSGLDDKVTVLPANASELGSPEYGPFDRIVTTLSAYDENQVSQLLDQLKNGGLMQISVIALRDGECVKPWIPGDRLLREDMVVADASKGFAYVIPYNFRKNGNVVEYSFDNKVDLEKRTGSGPLFQ